MRQRARRGIAIPLSISTGIMFLVVLLTLLVPSEDLHLGRGFQEELQSGWQIIAEGTTLQQVSLPTEIPVQPNEPYQAVYTFSVDYPDGMMLRIRASMQSVRVLLEGREIYASAKPEAALFFVPEASVWHFVALPSDLPGKKLTIQLASPVRNFAGIVNPVSIGTGDALLYGLFRQNRINLLIVLFLMVFGVLSVLVAFFVRQLQDNRLLYLGLFALMIGIWIFSETRLMQMITGNRYMLGSISYIMITLTPIPLLLYLRDAVFEGYRRLLNALAIAFFLWLAIQLPLQLTGLAALIETAIVSNSLILVTIVLIVCLLLRDMLKFKSRIARNFLIYSSALVLSVLIEILNFMTHNYDAISHYGRIGIVIFFLLLAGSSFRMINALLDQEKEAMVLSRLAYKDALTGAGNRLAFERDIADKFKQSDQEAFRLIIMDINNLKSINDRFGHLAGDEVIKACHAAMSAAIAANGICYRTGGDEFASIIGNTDPAEYRHITDTIRQKLAEAEADLPYHLELAVGSDVCRPDHTASLNAFIHHVDQLMYAEKKIMKQNIISHHLVDQERTAAYMPSGLSPTAHEP
ncbi:MAG: diguanylate cyclase [Bacillota bacterium]|nr:diguanylate cyclase [Bacillota bacterium]